MTSKLIKAVWTVDEPNSQPYQLLISRSYKTSEKAEREFMKYVSKIKKRTDVKDLTITETLMHFKIIINSIEIEHFFLRDKESNQTYQGQVTGLKNRHF